jgi:hypothetical protein
MFQREPVTENHGVGGTQIMTDAADPYEQAEQELASQGRPRPKGDAWLMCARDTLIALAAMILLELIIAGEGEDIDLMWIVVIGVGATSYAIRPTILHEYGGETWSGRLR